MSGLSTSAAEEAAPEAGEGSLAQPERPDLFISYSRKDEGFVNKLVVALERHGKDVWIDREDIRGGAEWWKKIQQGIEAARAIVPVVSPSFAESSTCREEVEHALTLNKRLVPVLREEVDSAAVNDRVAAINWIRIRPDDDFEQGVAKLVETAEADLEWLDQHARLSVRAGEWERARRDKSFLLTGADLDAAEDWLAGQGGHGETATPLQAEFILVSRRAAARRQRIILASVLCALVVSLSLAALAYWQRAVAIDNEQLAVENAKLSRSRELSAKSAAQIAGDPELALLLAVEAARVAPTSQAEEALRAALSQTHSAGAGTLRHGGLADVALTPNGRVAATASADTTVRIWDVERGRTLSTLRGHRPAIFGEASRGVMGVELSKDGRLAVTAGADGTARVWDTRSGKQLVKFADHRGAVLAISLSPGGGLVATGGEDGTLRTWERATGKPVRTVRPSDSWMTEVHFSPDGGRLATAATDTGLTIRDAATLRPLVRLPSGQVFAVAFSSDGRLLAAGGVGGTARMWDTTSGALLAEIPGHGESLNALAFDPTDKVVASAGSNGVVKVWRADAARPLRELRGHRGSVSAIAFSPDGRHIATASVDQTARVWDARDGRQLRVMRGHRQPVWFVTFLPRGRVATAGADGTLRIWNALPKRTTKELRGHRAVVNDVAFARDGSRLATASSDGTARLWNVATGRLVRTLGRRQGDVTAVRFSPDGRLLLSVGSDQARLWDARTGRPRSVLPEAVGRTAEFSRDSSLIVGSNGGIWKVTEGKLRATIRPPDNMPSAVALRPDGEALFVAPLEGPAGVFAVATGRRLVEFRGQTGVAVYSASFAPDGRTLAVQSSTRLGLWDARTGEKVWELPRGTQLASSEQPFSSDGSLLLATGRTGVRVWDVRRRRPVADLPHPRGTGEVEFSPDGRLILTAGWDGAVRVWVARTAALIAELPGRSSEEWSEGFTPSVAFGAHGDRIAAATGGRTAFIHECRLCAPLPGLLALAKRTATRKLTRDERLTYLGG